MKRRKRRTGRENDRVKRERNGEKGETEGER